MVKYGVDLITNPASNRLADRLKITNIVVHIKPGMHHFQTNNTISFIAEHAVVDIHFHMCYQIVVSLKTLFDCIIDGHTHAAMQGFLINQKISHLCQAGNTTVLVYFIDAESMAGWQLKALMDGRPCMDIAAILTPQQLEDLSASFGQAQSVTELRELAGNLLRQIIPVKNEPEAHVMDDRLPRILEYMGANLHSPILLEDVAELIFLSPERTRHLFVRETGIPFSQYLLWKRIKAVLTQVIHDDVPMISAVLENGFSDHAHFTHLFKRTFGISAKLMLKNSRFVQFLTPEL